MTTIGQPIRVMHLINAYQHGGAEMVIRDLIANSNRQQFEYQVCSLMNHYPTRHWLEELDVRLVSPDFTHLLSPQRVPQLLTLVRQFRPHVLHSHLPMSDLHAWSLRRLLGNPAMITTMHNMAEYYYETHRGLCRCCENWLHKTAMKRWPGTVVGIGAAIKNSFAPYLRNWEQMPVVENGIDEARLKAQSRRSRRQMRDELGIDEDAIVFLSAGRLTEQKRYDVLVQAVSLLDEPNLQYVSLVAGTGPLEAHVRELVNKHGLDHRIQLLGVRDDVPDLMKAADCFLMTSEVEGLPMALLEAMMLGLPTVSTAVGAIPDVVEDGVTGRLMPSEDISAIAAALREVLLAPEQLRVWGEQAREQARSRYSASLMSQKYERLYESLLQQRAKVHG